MIIKKGKGVKIICARCLIFLRISCKYTANCGGLVLTQTCHLDWHRCRNLHAYTPIGSCEKLSGVAGTLFPPLPGILWVRARLPANDSTAVPCDTGAAKVLPALTGPYSATGKRLSLLEYLGALAIEESVLAERAAQLILLVVSELLIRVKLTPTLRTLYPEDIFFQCHRFLP